MTGMPVGLLDLGRRSYSDVWQFQRHLVDARARGLAQDTLILVEHDHVITLGRKTSPENFRAQDVPVFQVERGGDATYHGPGQLVGYPIVKMEVPDVRGFVKRLEDVLINTLNDFAITAGLRENHIGVWLVNEDGEHKKIASIGVAVTNWVTYHGFALNVNTDLSYFHLIKPCGLDPDTMTSMKAVLGREVNLESVKEVTIRNFSRVFRRPIEAVSEASLPAV